MEMTDCLVETQGLHATPLQSVPFCSDLMISISKLVEAQVQEQRIQQNRPTLMCWETTGSPVPAASREQAAGWGRVPYF
ncbi:hypothetical protein E2C01_000334 [Portunus trituberculatus]|uniref:Uncharacterized protein n=1 Tax=Portunus trituberculatus TaxID=210409 RepID=A0A5B7CEE1_PORTR|nr:hypothetical protein [Portunus trituberculatus]